MSRPKKNKLENLDQLNAKTTTKLEDLHQIDGRISSSIPSTLESIIHEGSIGKYSDISESSYEKKIQEMNKPELEAEAHTLGVMIVDDVGRLRNNLIREYKNYYLARTTPTQPKNQSKRQMSLEAQKILDEGK